MNAEKPGGRASAPFLFALALLAPFAAPAGDWQPYVAVDSFAHAEPKTIHDYIDDFDGPLHGGSDALTHNWFETGARHGAWSYGYVQRYDYEIKATRDSAVLYHQVKNKIDLVPGTTYDLGVRAFHNRSQGLRVAYRFEGADWSVEPGLSLLSGQALTDGSIAGVATAVQAKEYAYNAEVGYHYTEDFLFDRDVRGPTGEGWSLDLGLHYRPMPDWELSLVGRDLLGFLYWRDAPVTTAVATSDTREFDDDGYVVFRPMLTGREFNEDYSQRLHPRGLAVLQWQATQGTQLGLRWRLTEVRQYLSLVAAQQLAKEVSVDLEWMPDLQAYGAGLRWSGFRLGLMADALRFEETQVLQLQLGWAYRFE